MKFAPEPPGSSDTQKIHHKKQNINPICRSHSTAGSSGFCKSQLNKESCKHLNQNKLAPPERRFLWKGFKILPSHWICVVSVVCCLNISPLTFLSSVTDVPPGRISTLSVSVCHLRAPWHLSEWSVFLRGAIFEQVMFTSVRGDKQEARRLFSLSSLSSCKV